MSKLITLFIEELNQVRGGINRGGDPGGTSTLAAYEEGGKPTPFDTPSTSTLAAYEEGGQPTPFDPSSSTLAGYEDGGKWGDMLSTPSSGSN